LLSLGCQMNTSDAERISTVLEGAGFAEAPTEAQANLLGVVACSVRQKAIDRVYGRIHEWNRWKRERPLLTFVSGCILPEDEAKFLRLFDLVFRIDDLPQLPEMIRTSGVVTPAAIDAALQPERSVTLNHTDQFWGIAPRYGSTHAAYVPIQNGCDKFCTFCAVPYTRGREVSRPSSGILDEVGRLVGLGYNSITLLGQNVNSYGTDKSGECSFAELLDRVGGLCEKAGRTIWIYYTSPHPQDMSTEVLQTMAAHPSIAKQVHLPLQSGDDKVLIRMNRNYRLDRYRRIVEEIRRILPQATLSTDIIVGFTGETDEQFEQTRRAMREFRYNMAYIAAYSPRPGAASSRWADDVPAAVKKERVQILSDELQRSAGVYNAALVGSTQPVLVEGKARRAGYLSGRTEGRVIVRFPERADVRPGDVVPVRVTGAAPLSVEGEAAVTPAEADTPAEELAS
jgi:tRNA-2-methylthio-N6-dimethylallyladenosine synthase